MKGNRQDVVRSVLYTAIILVSLAFGFGLVNQAIAANSNTVNTPQIGIQDDIDCDLH